jgi:hypothetical protein
MEAGSMVGQVSEHEGAPVEEAAPRAGRRRKRRSRVEGLKTQLAAASCDLCGEGPAICVIRARAVVTDRTVRESVIRSTRRLCRACAEPLLRPLPSKTRARVRTRRTRCKPS